MHNPAVPDPLPAPEQNAGPLSPAVAHRITAVVELPFDNLEQATVALQGHLRHMLTERLNIPAGRPSQVMDWDTLTVTGPTQQTDPGGRTWFSYTGTASSRLLRPVDPFDTGQQPRP